MIKAIPVHLNPNTEVNYTRGSGESRDSDRCAVHGSGENHPVLPILTLPALLALRAPVHPFRNSGSIVPGVLELEEQERLVRAVGPDSGAGRRGRLGLPSAAELARPVGLEPTTF